MTTHGGDIVVRHDQLITWTIYYDPSDYPGKYVVRGWNVAPELGMHETVNIADTLEEARSFIPPNLYKIPRLDDDDAVIVEIWI